MSFKLFPLNSVCATTEQLAGRFREIITAKIIILFKCSNPRYLRIITAVYTLSATPPHLLQVLSYVRYWIAKKMMIQNVSSEFSTTKVTADLF